MELERDMLVFPAGEVPVIEGELVTAIRTLADRGVGKKGDCPRGRRRRQYGAAVFAGSDHAGAAGPPSRAAADRRSPG